MMGELDEMLPSIVEPIVAGMGFSLVELRHSRSKNQNHLAVIVYGPQGVGVSDCAEISKNLSPRLELLEELQNLRLQVSSPGLDRVIKDPREYRIFGGRGVRIFRKGENDWQGGLIVEVRDEHLVVNCDGIENKIPLADIRKARLDETQEGST